MSTKPTRQAPRILFTGRPCKRNAQGIIAGAHTSLSHGMALVTGLLLLLALTIVAIAAMQITSMGYKMSANSANQSRARQISESARMALSSVLPEHVYRREWNGIDLATGLTIKDKDSSGSPDKLFGGNTECTDGCFNHDALTEDAVFAIDMDNADADDDVETGTSDPLDLAASMAVYRTATHLDKGAGSAMIAGYMGLGKGAAGGGTLVHFYVRSDGNAASNARVTTSTDVKSRVFN